MLKVRFSSDDLPPGLSDSEKFDAWRRFLAGFYTDLQMERHEDRPFAITFDAAQVGGFRLGRVDGSLKRIARTPTQIAQTGNDDFIVAFNTTSAPLHFSRPGGEITLAPDAAVLASNGEPGVVRSDDRVGWMFIGIPDPALTDLLPGVDDLIGKPFDLNNPAIRQLERYAMLLLDPGEVPDDPLLTAHIEATLHDLIVIAFGYEREMASIARMGTTRGAQFRAVVQEIKASFQHPEFSPEQVCKKLDVSARYLQALLTESGASFTERVTELRLQRARSLLERAANQHVKISDIAFLSGFSDVSYFNRCFRQRFAMAPSAFRAARLGQNAEE